MSRTSIPMKMLAFAGLLILASCEKENEPGPDPEPSPSGLKYEVVAGSTALSGLVNGQGAAANFDGPSGLALDNSGNILVADTRNNAIRRMTPSYLVSTVAGQGPSITQLGNNDGTTAEARFWNPYFLSVDAAGSIYVADGMSNYVRKISGSQVTTVTERASAGSAPRYLHSILSLPSGYVVRGMGFDRVKNRIVVSIDGSRVWAIAPATGQLTVLAGTGVPGYRDGDAASAQFSELNAVAVDGSGNIYVADNYRKTGSNAFNTRIRKISATGTVSTLTGFESTQSQYINALAVDRDGESLIAFIVKQNIVGDGPDPNAANYVIAKVSATGVVSGILEATDPYNATAADKFVFGRAGGMVVDASGAIYMSSGVIGKITGR